jgi:hypothetical protein
MTDLVEQWRLAAAEWLDLQDAADLLRETKNDVFAEIMSDMNCKTVAEADRTARCTERWQDFRNQMLDAEKKARRAKMRVRYVQMKFDSWRTENANARTERHHG